MIWVEGQRFVTAGQIDLLLGYRQIVDPIDTNVERAEKSAVKHVKSGTGWMSLYRTS